MHTACRVTPRLPQMPPQKPGIRTLTARPFMVWAGTLALVLGLALALTMAQSLVCPDAAFAASAYSPRHSGTEAPGGPKPIEGLPGRGDRSGTVPSGSGYTDAYGNTIDDVTPEEKPRPPRPRPGAYGTYGATTSDYDRPLPDPSKKSAQPAWTYK